MKAGGCREPFEVRKRRPATSRPRPGPCALRARPLSLGVAPSPNPSARSAVLKPPRTQAWQACVDSVMGADMDAGARKDAVDKCSGVVRICARGLGVPEAARGGLACGGWGGRAGGAAAAG